MDPHLLFKDAQQESRQFTRRTLVAWFLILLAAGLLVARLVYLQVLQHAHFITLSENNRLKILPLPPNRGLIYDRNGVLLAENRPSYSLEIVPEQVEDMPALLAELGKLIPITETDLARFDKARKQMRRFESVPLRQRLNETEIAVFSVHRHRFPGADIGASQSRQYPLGEHGVHAIGYVARINEEELKSVDTSNYSGTNYIGKLGIEKFYEDELHGKVGYQKVETNVRGRVLRVLERSLAVPGDNLYLHLDIGLQMYAEQILAGERAALVAIDPGTGGVLALVSTPGYDPNLFVGGIDNETYQALRQSPDRPLYNRAIRGIYPPGSTVKAFVGLAGLEYGVRTLQHRTWCPGAYSLPNQSHKYRDWKKTGHGSMDLHHAIEQSCDVYFYDLAYDLGIERLSKFMQRFGFGEKTGIDMVGELGGLMPTAEWKRRTRKQPWYPGETLIAGIGQGYVLATPLQLAAATATLSMRGQIRQPRLVFAIDGVEDGRMRLVSSQSPASISLREPGFWDAAIGGMEAVVHGERGTARRVGLNSPYRIAGKTGTAQVVGIKQDERYDAKKLDKRFHDHAWFIAFAPVEAPRIAVAVLIENGGSGSGAAAPVAKKIIDYYLKGGLPAGEEPAPQAATPSAQDAHGHPTE